MGQKLISMSAAARLWGVAPKTVREWWLKGYLVRASDGRVDVERSEARLKRRPHRYRGGVCRGPVAPVQTRAERLLARMRDLCPGYPDEELIAALEAKGVHFP
jgi:hypothetical protein